MKLQSILCLRMSSGLEEIVRRWKTWKRWHCSTFPGVGWWGREVWRSTSIHQRFTQSPPEKRWALFSEPSLVLKILNKLIVLNVLLILIIAISYLDYLDSLQGGPSYQRVLRDAGGGLQLRVLHERSRFGACLKTQKNLIFNIIIWGP